MVLFVDNIYIHETISCLLACQDSREYFFFLEVCWLVDVFQSMLQGGGYKLHLCDKYR